MKTQTGESYTSSKYAKAMVVAPAKEGKTTFLVASALGLLPWQRGGGIVDRPENLHLVAVDAGAVSGVAGFLTKVCGASPEALKFTVYNLQDDARKVSMSETAGDMDFYNTVMQVLQTVALKASKGGTHVLHFSSLTGVSQAIIRAISGPPKKAGNMDQNKWSSVSSQLNEIRNYAQVDSWHCIWEGHVFKPPATGQDGEPKPETIQLQGSAGHNFPYNVEQVLRMRRMAGQKYAPQGGSPTQCDKTFVETQPRLDFMLTGRGFNELLQPQEHDLAEVFRKLGLQTGGWGAKSAPVKAVAKAATK